jgi:D-alanyl-lipoteichoic acid acyltransferase DltB (MBOAT superfamily)
MIWYGSWKIEWPLLLFLIANVNFLILKLIDRGERKEVHFLGLVSLNALIFLVLKSSLFGANFIQSPFGSSFYIFIILSLVIDRWRSLSDHTPYRWTEFVLLPSFFPLLMGGPIERGKKFFHEVRTEKKLELDNIVNGIIIFSIGLIKKEFIHRPLENFPSLIPHGGMGFLLLGFSVTFLTYLEFSSYTEMGRGVARMFGIDLSISFRPFYYAKNPNDFWQRWNITLGTWLRDYLSFPLMLKYGRVLGQNVILLVTFLLMGLWHGITLKHLYFGLYNGLVVVFYNFSNKKVKLPIWGRLCAFIIIIGNGLLDVYDNTFQAKKLEHSLDENMMAYTLLFALIAFEWFQERRNDENWYLKIGRGWKIVVSLVFVALYFWYLNSNMMTNEPDYKVPIYFKI